MKFSLEWLSGFVAPLPPLDVLCERLTMAGLEVESTESVCATLDQVVVARITAIKAHPDADHLNICIVDVGDGRVSEVVCGAPNARVDLLGCLALPGAVLLNGSQVSVNEIRGVRSHGMLCSAAELGLGDDDDGLLELERDAVPGTPIKMLCRPEDTWMELGLTPNRGDCLSLLGVAREISALQGLELTLPETASVPAIASQAFPVRLGEPSLCPRYVGRVLEDVDASRPTPLWMRERLRSAGVRSINLVVDITNYVMLAVGQPMHAFDLDTLAKGIEVRRAASGESVVLLDGSNLALDETSLVIADHQRVLALAGVMGGRDSGVNVGTRRVFLESAWFDPVAIAGTARRLKLHTDASHRFERGVDPEGQGRAIELASRLLVELAGAVPGPVTRAEAGSPPVPSPILFRLARANSLLGTSFGESEARSIFQRLHLQVAGAGDAWQVTPPSYRADLGREEDLVEELARLAGYANLPTTLPRVGLAVEFESPETALPDFIRDALAGTGYAEVVTYSFIAPELWDLFAGALPPRVLANPISSEMAVMRASLVPGLLGVMAHNQKRQVNDQRVFELGMVFREESAGLVQTNRVAGAVMGAVVPEQWAESSRPVDFFDVKQDVESLLRACRLDKVDWVPAEVPGLHPGATARLLADGREIGIVGRVHPRVCRRLDLSGAPVVFELHLGALAAGRLPAFRPFSRFPSTRRDLAIVVGEEVSVAAVMGCVRQAGGELLRDLQLFDVYRGQGIDSGKKSLALGLLFQASSSTLVDSQVDALVTEITNRLRTELRASLRV